MGNKIVVTNLSKSFGKKLVLDNISFALEPSTSLAVLGGSGSGKSVLLRCLAGLTLPSPQSSILIGGVELSQVPISKRQDFVTKFSMLFQGNALFDSLPVWENIVFAGRQNQGLTKTDGLAKAIEYLKMVELNAKVAFLKPDEISGGMQKRVAIARALASVQSLEALFLDEPTAGLDPVTAYKITSLLARLRRDLNVTIITITHDPICIKGIADKVMVIDNKKIGWLGEIKEIWTAENEFLQAFLKAAADWIRA